MDSRSSLQNSAPVIDYVQNSILWISMRRQQNIYSPCQCVVVNDIHSSTNSGHFSASSPKNTANESSVANRLNTL